MPVTQIAPQTLLVVPYTLTGYSVTTTGAGAALGDAGLAPQPWGGTFISATRPVMVEVVIPLMGMTVGSATATVIAHIMIDGVEKSSAYRHSAVANTDSGREYIKFPLIGLAAGSHTVAVQLQPSSGTGYIQGQATNPATIIVSEY